MLNKIFSVVNEGTRKVITILGIKIKLKSKKLEQKLELKKLRNLIKQVATKNNEIKLENDKIKTEIQELNNSLNLLSLKVRNDSKRFEIIVPAIAKEKTAERIFPELYAMDESNWLLFLKHKFAYELAKKYIKPFYKVLEIGFGDGYGTEILAKTGCEIYAVDMDADLIKDAKAKYKRDNLHFDCYDGKNLNYEKHSFDMVVSYQVIEHVEDVELYLNNIKDMLKHEGLFLITTPSRTYRLSPNQKPWNKFHLREYDFSTLQNESKQILPDGNIYSITADNNILEIEFNRVKSNRADYNPAQKKKIEQSVDYLLKYSMKNFKVSDKDIDDGLDLLLTNIDL